MFIDLAFQVLTNPVVVALYALLFGSFLSVCIYRIPYGRPKGLASFDYTDEEVEQMIKDNKDKISILFPARSFCPVCKNQLKWYHNIPVFSWILQRGKCAFCKTKIPFRYPLVELLSAGFALLCLYHFSPLAALLVYVFCCSLIVITFIDLDYFIIPDVISYPGLIIGLIIACINQFLNVPIPEPFVSGIVPSLLGVLVGGGFLWLVSEIFYRLTKKHGLGFGDVKLMAMVGALFGPMVCYQGILFGSVAGAVLGSLMILMSKKEAAQPIPFGPYLAIGTLVSLFTDYNFF